LGAAFLVFGLAGLVADASFVAFGADVPFVAFGVVFNLMFALGFLAESGRCGV
jgi:hypothetical protein